MLTQNPSRTTRSAHPVEAGNPLIFLLILRPHESQVDDHHDPPYKGTATRKAVKARPRILILTAGFGDGHNSAARNLARALQDHSHVQVEDPCENGSPRLNDLLREGYRHLITHAPLLWHWLYKSSDQQDFSRPRRFLRATTQALADTVTRFQPHLVVSTYPLYPYLLEHGFQKGSAGRRVPVITIVTDSLEINSVWTRAPSDHFLVTDPATRDLLLAPPASLPAERVHSLGFPVNPSFPHLQPLSSSTPIRPFRVLFFATRRFRHLSRIARAVLSIPGTHLTIILGRSIRPLYHRAREISRTHPDRVTLKGWTQRVPELMCSHHLTIGKAGGATVHEAMAAKCPMLIHHRVPGQEDGNIALLESLGLGRFTPDPASIRAEIEHFMADHGRAWRACKKRFQHHSRPAGATDTAQFLLRLHRDREDPLHQQSEAPPDL